MYEKLKRLITDKNALYKELNDEVHQLEQSVNEEAEALKNARFERWQFIHDYAQSLADFLWYNMCDLTPKDLSALDLVPYAVWRKMDEKSHAVVDAITRIHNGEKPKAHGMTSVIDFHNQKQKGSHEQGKTKKTDLCHYQMGGHFDGHSDACYDDWLFPRNC